MNRFKVGATSANLGIGFDCLGLALELFNEYETELSFKDEIKGFANDCDDDNLFLYAYHQTARYLGLEDDHVKIHAKCDIPVSRGLGSSAALIVGGIYAYSILHGNCLDKETMLKIASAIEGHPDNVAPAIYGNLCIVHRNMLKNIEIDRRWKIGLWIPDYEVSTAKARAVLKNEYARAEVVNNVSAAMLAIEALKDFDLDGISCIMDDLIHEPYRRSLLKDFEKLKDYALNKGAKAFVISGSGSTCLSLSDKPLQIEYENMIYKEVKVNSGGIIYVQ